MAAKSWANAVSGNWTTSADWSGGTPTSADDVTIGLVGNYTVSVSSAAAANSVVFNAPGAQFTETAAGSLNIAQYFDLEQGTVVLNGVNTFGYSLRLYDGELDIGNGGALGGGGVDINGGTLLGTTTETLSGFIYIHGGTETLAAAHGTTLTLTNVGYQTGGKTTLIGALGDDGTIVWTGGFGTSGGLNGTETLDVAYGTLKGGDANFGQLFGGYDVTDLESAATIDLNGFAVTIAALSGGGQIVNSSATAAALALNGTTQFYSGTLSGPMSLTINGTAEIGTCQIVGGATLAASTTLTIQDRFTLVTDDGITGTDATSAVTNYGVFEKIGGNGTSTISAVFTNGHDVDLLSGNLAFTAAFTNDGTIDVREGQIVFSGGFDNEGIVHGVLGSSGANTTITANAPGQSTWFGSYGSDYFILPGAATYVNGSGGYDSIELTGNATFAAGSVVNVEAFTIDNGVTANLSALHNAENIYLGSVSGGTAAVTGTQGADAFFAGSGDDTIGGSAGNDAIAMNRYFTAADRLDGGTGIDTVKLSGDYSGTNAVVFSATTMVNVENLVLAAGYSYNLTTNNATVAAGQTLTVDASALGASDTLTFNGAAETDGAFHILAGAGTNVLTGGLGADTFLFAPLGLNAGDVVNGGTGAAIDQLQFSLAGTVTAASLAHVTHIEALVLANGTNSIAIPNALVVSADDSQVLTVVGGSGNDSVNASAVTTATAVVKFTAGAGNDSFTGGAGADVVSFATADFNGSDTVNGGTGTALDGLSFTTNGYVTAAAFAGVSHIERIFLSAGASHNLTLSDALVASADDSHLLTIVGNSGNDTVNASAVLAGDSVRFEGGGAADRFIAGGGTDTFLYFAPSDSTGDANGTRYDTVIHFNPAADRFDLPSGFSVASVSTVSSGSLSGGTGTFDSDMAAAIGSHLAAHTAVDFTVTAGNLSGQEFLVVNPTASNGYVSGADYVFDVTGHYAGPFTTGDFV